MAYRREKYPDTGERPWLDRPDAEQAIAAKRAAGELTDEQARQLQHWTREGYVILKDILDSDACEAINADVQKVYDENCHRPFPELKMKFQDMYPDSASTRQAMVHPPLLEWLDLILGVPALPFQTLNLPKSSQQGAHSDEILMTTNPPGFMLAAWYALEDVHDDAGPLAILPTSHRYPYVGAQEIGIPVGASEEEASRIFDSAYYERMGQVVADSDVKPVPFLAKQGDVLVWHSNLLHGAHHTRREGATRKSLIIHYYGKGVETYSDLWQKQNVMPGLR